MRASEQLSEIYLDENGLLPQVGDVIQNPCLAHALERIRDNGPEGFYSGPVAEAIIHVVQKAGGVMVQENLDNCSCWEEEPVATTYQGYQVISSPSPSSGGTFIVTGTGSANSVESGKAPLSSLSSTVVLVPDRTFPVPTGIRYVDGGLEGTVNHENSDGVAIDF